MISSYRIHQEQIKKVEESLRAPYRRTGAEPGVHEISGRATVLAKQPVVRGTGQRRQLRFRDEDSKRSRSIPGGRYAFTPKSPNLPPPPVPAMRCVQCNSRIYEMDYLYTKKTGLCIPCWEEQEA